MKMTLRWFGADDPVSLEYIRQIPGVTGIVSSLHSAAPGDEWHVSDVDAVAERIAGAGLSWSVVESIPVHESIKLGGPDREHYTERWCRSVEQVARVGVPVVCYNFMPVFDWTRTNLALPLDDGSTALAYDHAALQRVDLSKGTGDLPGWGAAYDATALRALLDEWRKVDAERLWDNLAWFLERVVPVAAANGVKLAIHPDDPPWPVFGLPRIITNRAALSRLLSLVDNNANGLTFCTGSLGADGANDLVAMAREFAAADRIHFMHCRNVLRTGPRDFRESAHPTRFGSVNMHGVLAELRAAGFAGPMRPDHGRMIWGEQGRPGYGLYDRALGAMYLQGLWEGLGGEATA